MNLHRRPKLGNFIKVSLLVVFFLSSTFTTVCYAKQQKISTSDFRDTIPPDQLMKESAALSAAVYKNQGGEEIKIRWPSGYEDVGFIETSDGTQVWVLKKNGIPTIAFRGTDEQKDWYTNLDMDREKPKMMRAKGKVHSGFQESLFKPHKRLSLYSSKTKQTREIKNGFVSTELEILLLQDCRMTTKLHVTGHSLGGALSMVMSAYLAAKRPQLRVTMITFGAPRVGSKDWRNWANSVANLRMFRYTYQTDIVPRIPPPGTYHHAGHTIWVKEGSKEVYNNRSYIYYRHDGCKAAGKDTEKFCQKNGLDSVPFSWNVPSTKSKSDHGIQNYMKAVKKGIRFLPKYFEDDDED